MRIPKKYSDFNNQNIKVVVLKNNTIDSVSDSEQAFYEKSMLATSEDDKKISSTSTIKL
jgi:hypothetical protein